MIARGAVALCIVVAGAGLGCLQEPALGKSCTRDGDCQAPLVCTDGLCLPARAGEGEGEGAEGEGEGEGEGGGEGSCGVPRDAVLGENAGDNSAGTTEVTGTGACLNDAGGHEDVWRFVPAASGAVSARVVPSAGLDLGVRARSECAGADLACTDELPADGVESLVVPVTAGDPVLFIVDGFRSDDVGPYTLTLFSSPACGDGIVDAGEDCDDGGRFPFLCSSACRLVPTPQTLSEPDDDGTATPNGGLGNDFDAAAAQINTLPVGGALLSGSLDAAGDEDYVVLDNSTAATVRLFAFVSGPDLQGCSGDPQLVVRDAGGGLVDSNDDGWFGKCPALAFTVDAQSSAVVEVLATGDDSALGAYTLALTPTP